MKRSITGAVLIAVLAAVGYFYFNRERLTAGPTVVSQPSTPEARARAISLADDVAVVVGAHASPASPALQTETQPAVSEASRSETETKAVLSLEDRLFIGQQYDQQEALQLIRTPEAFTTLFEELVAQAASNTHAAEMTQLYEEQLADLLEESQSGSELLRVACSARLCALELESPEGSDLTSLSSSMGSSLHFYSSVAAQGNSAGQPRWTRLVFIVDPNVRVRDSGQLRGGG